ncbi:MAG: magnesium transporter [Gemmatimonadetes bacterium]|jgi:magnesium transporter|nr:magnesium transporter [Gemmatimonadota bacterium]
MTPSQHNPEERPVGALLAPDIMVLLQESPELIAADTEELHPADLADVAEAIPVGLIPQFLAALPTDRAASVLEYLDEDLRVEVLEAMSPEQAAALVSAMNPDERADVLEELDEERADEIVDEMPAETRRETQQLRRYDPDSAGGIMTTEVVKVRSTTTVEDALVQVRVIARSDKREAMHAIYTTDAEGRLEGVLSLRELLAAPEGSLLADIAWTEVQSVSPYADREEVARLISNYDLVVVPVVSESGHVIGAITVDDVIDAIQEEQTEDVQKLGGMEALDEPYNTIGFWAMIRKRAVWLSALFIGEMFTATALGIYQKEIDRATVLAIFLPLIVSSGGNSGSQGTSLIIRALALREISLRDWWRVAGREVMTGLVLGVLLAVIGFGRIELWQAMAHNGWSVLGMSVGHDYSCVSTGAEQLARCGVVNPHLVALTVALSLIGVVTFGTVAGALMPFAMRRLGFDPASASAPFIATFVDVAGLIIYFNVALHLLLR